MLLVFSVFSGNNNFENLHKDFSTTTYPINLKFSENFYLLKYYDLSENFFQFMLEI